jgi:hypothetical protein
VTAQACQHHPREVAVGICMRCSAPLCDACVTKLDGVNHCQRCLLQRAEDQRAGTLQGDRPQGTRLAWLSLGLGGLLLATLAWTMLSAVLPKGAP